MKRSLVQASLALVALAGCGNLANLDAGPPACLRDSDCGAGQICLDVGCAAPNQDLVVQVAPPSSNADVVTQDFALVNTSHSIDLSLSRPVQLHIDSTVFPLSLALSGTSLNLPDFALSVPTARYASPTTLPLPTGSFTVTAVPVDPRIPPVQLSQVLDTPGAPIELALGFVDASAAMALAATLHAPLLVGPDNPTVIFNVQAQRADGTPLSQAVTTHSLAASSAPGIFDFALSLAPGEPDEEVQLVVSPSSGLGPSAILVDTRAGFAARAADGGLDLGEVSPGQVKGTIQDASGHPVVGASVKLVGQLPLGERFVSEAVVTGPRGGYSAACLRVPPGSSPAAIYQVQVVPPAGSGLAITQGADFPLGEAQELPTVIIQPLTEVTGRILDATGQPVLGATVQASPSLDRNVLPLQGAAATSDFAGNFHLGLTPGTYSFDYTAPLALQAPGNSRGPIAVGPGNASLPDFQFSASQTVSGSVRGPDGTAVVGALIRVFHVSPAMAGLRGRSTLLARSQVLPDGTFTVNLPAPPAAK